MAIVRNSLNSDNAIFVSHCRIIDVIPAKSKV